jgi:hypothetical protein
MLKYVSYALATFCFSASVGCLALWWRSHLASDRLIGPSYSQPPNVLHCETTHGILVMGLVNRAGRPMTSFTLVKGWDAIPPSFLQHRNANGLFGSYGESVYFPLWYPAFVFALAGVCALRLGRRFTLRSAIIATTVVAGLLGMAVGL